MRKEKAYAQGNKKEEAMSKQDKRSLLGRLMVHNPPTDEQIKSKATIEIHRYTSIYKVTDSVPERQVQTCLSTKNR